MNAIRPKGGTKMKIAITSLGQDLNSQIDPRFGRAAYILIVDTAHNGVEIKDPGPEGPALIHFQNQ